MNERTFRPERAHKLEDPERQKWLPLSAVIERLSLHSGMVVADVGAGTGYFAFPIARTVAPGMVYAVDSQPPMLALMKEKLPNESVENVVLVSGEAEATTLPTASCDLVLMANVWHELDDHEAVLGEMNRILKAEGVLAILDWRHDVATPPGPPLQHRVAMTTVLSLLRSQGWTATDARELGTYSYLVLSSHL